MRGRFAEENQGVRTRAGVLRTVSPVPLSAGEKPRAGRDRTSAHLRECPFLAETNVSTRYFREEKNLRGGKVRVPAPRRSCAILERNPEPAEKAHRGGGAVDPLDDRRTMTRRSLSLR